MPFHLMIWPASDGQQSLRELFAFNVDEGTLRSRFIEPYERADPITWHGRTLPGGDISYLHVSETPSALDEETARRTFREYEAFKSGTDVTDAWITRAAGSRRKDQPTDRQPARPIQHDVTNDADSARRDVFLSHASEDKDLIARELARALQERGYTVWFDEFELTVGDSLSECIDEGLASSRFGVVIVSRAFLAKSWPRRELQGLVAKEMVGGQRVILPVWHGVDHAAVAAASPPLADRLAADSADGVDAVADQIAAAIDRRRDQENRASRTYPALATADSARDGVADEGIAWRNQDLRDDLVGLLRAKDGIGVQEMLRAERRHFEDGVLSALADAGDELGSHIDLPRLQTLEVDLWGLVERRLATLLALLEYSPALMQAEARRLADLADSEVPTTSNVGEWRQGAKWPVWILVRLIGAAAVNERQWSVVKQLWDARTTAPSRPLAIVELDRAERLGEELAHARPKMSISSPAKTFWHTAFRGSGSPLIRERYRDLLRRPAINDPVLSLVSLMGDFSWLTATLAGHDGLAAAQYWGMAQVELRLPAYLARNPGELERLAESLFQLPGVTEDQLEEWARSSSS